MIRKPGHTCSWREIVDEHIKTWQGHHHGLVACLRGSIYRLSSLHQVVFPSPSTSRKKRLGQHATQPARLAFSEETENQLNSCNHRQPNHASSGIGKFSSTLPSGFGLPFSCGNPATRCRCRIWWRSCAGRVKSVTACATIWSARPFWRRWIIPTTASVNSFPRGEECG